MSKFLCVPLLAASLLATNNSEAHAGHRRDCDVRYEKCDARRDDIYDLREVRDIKKQLIYISEIDSRFRKERRLRRLDNRFLRLLRAERYENIHEDRYENYGKSEQDLYSDIKVIYRRWKRLQGYYDYESIEDRKKLLHYYEDLAIEEVKSHRRQYPRRRHKREDVGKAVIKDIARIIIDSL